MSPLFQRLIKGVGANAFGQLVTISIQIVSLPIFMSFWDSSYYGEWLIISAMPSCLAMADVGLVSTASNRISMAVAAGKIKLANSIFHSSILFLIVISFLVVAITIPIAIFFPVPGWVMGNHRFAVIALILGILLVLFSGLLEAHFRATNRYSLGTMLSNISRLLEFLGGMIGLFLNKEYIGVAIGMLLGRISGFLFMFFWAKQDLRLSWGISKSSFAEIKYMFRPALAFMVFPVANAFTFQGVTLIVGYLLGPASVAIFNTYRTLARVCVQFTGIFSHALWPEFSRVYASGNRESLKKLYKNGVFFGAIGVFLICFILFLLSPWILKVWGRGRIEVDMALMALMLAYALVGGLWHVPRIFLMSINMHESLAIWTFIFGVSIAPISYVMGSIFSLYGVCGSLLLTELCLAGGAYFLADKLSGVKFFARGNYAS